MRWLSGADVGDGSLTRDGRFIFFSKRNQVKRQRDRFRKEALRREREASIAKGNSEQLTRDNQELRKENMHLYKKIRWVPLPPHKSRHVPAREY